MLLQHPDDLVRHRNWTGLVGAARKNSAIRRRRRTTTMMMRMRMRMRMTDDHDDDDDDDVMMMIMMMMIMMMTMIMTMMQIGERLEDRAAALEAEERKREGLQER
jgi:hypothetical protein